MPRTIVEVMSCKSNITTLTKGIKGFYRREEVSLKRTMTYKDRNACSVDATSEAVYTLRISETESLGESECQGVVPSSGG